MWINDVHVGCSHIRGINRLRLKCGLGYVSKLSRPINSLNARFIN